MSTLNQVCSKLLMPLVTQRAARSRCLLPLAIYALKCVAFVYVGVRRGQRIVCVGPAVTSLRLMSERRRE